MRKQLIEGLDIIAPWLVAAFVVWFYVVSLRLVIFANRLYQAQNRKAYLVYHLRSNRITNRLFRRWLYFQCPGCDRYYTGLEKRDRGWYCGSCHERLDVEFRDWVAKQIDSGNVPPSVMLYRLKTKGTMDAAALWFIVFILVVVFIFTRLFLH